MIRESVIPALLRAKEKDQKRKIIKPIIFQVGDQVMIYQNNASPLEPKWKGPVTISKCYDHGTYAYELPNGKNSKAINGDRLKLFKGRQNWEPIVVIETV